MVVVQTKNGIGLRWAHGLTQTGSRHNPAGPHFFEQEVICALLNLNQLGSGIIAYKSQEGQPQQHILPQILGF
jgi:hypothetical protein